jgi:aldose 1-epimerase
MQGTRRGIELEEQRISRMYLNLLTKRLVRFWDSLFPRGLMRSPFLPVLVVLVLIGIPGFGYFLHRRGQIHRLRNEIQGDSAAQTPTGPRPGGADPIVLTRAKTGEVAAPEFRSATLLPGLGMSVLQITADLPGRGEVSLLAAPSVEEVAAGTVTPKIGQNDTRGAFEVPWGGVLGGQLSPVGTLRASWRGHMLEAPAEVLSRGVAVGGLLALQAADSAQADAHSDTATATFGSTDFEGHWVAKTDVSVNVSLGAQMIVLTVTAKNIGDQAEPMGIGWHPRFQILSNRREDVEVRLPAGDQLEIADATKGLPTGRVIAPTSRLARFQGRGDALGEEGIDESVVNSKEGALDAGAAAEMRDPGADFGLRLTALSPTIHAIRVTSPSGSNYVSLGAQTNYDDPLGKEWGVGDTPAIVTLQPGQSVTWKVKLEIFPLVKK